jgi:hypothetical protein
LHLKPSFPVGQQSIGNEELPELKLPGFAHVQKNDEAGMPRVRFGGLRKSTALIVRMTRPSAFAKARTASSGAFGSSLSSDRIVSMPRCSDDA